MSSMPIRTSERSREENLARKHESTEENHGIFWKPRHYAVSKRPTRSFPCFRASVPKLLLIAPIACVATACGGEQERPSELDVVRVGRSNLLTNAPIVLGDAAGDFAREGVRLEYVEIPAVTVQALPGLADGSVDVVASVMSIGLINAIGGGAHFRIVADRGYLARTACEAFGIVGRKGLFGDKPVDASVLRGARVSTNAVGQSGYLMSKFLGRHGLSLSDVKLERMPANTEPTAMDNGTLDIVSRGDPQLHAMLSSGHRLLAGASTLAPGQSIAVLVYGPTLLSRDRELGLRFMKGYLRAVRRFMQGKTADNVRKISSRLGVDSADLVKMCWPSTRPDGSVSRETLVDYQRWAVGTGSLDRTIEPSLLVDTTFASQASRALDAEAAGR